MKFFDDAHSPENLCQSVPPLNLYTNPSLSFSFNQLSRLVQDFVLFCSVIQVYHVEIVA